MIDIRNVPNAYIKVMMIYKHVICWVCGISELIDNKGSCFSTIHKTIQSKMQQIPVKVGKSPESRYDRENFSNSIVD